MWRTDKNGVNLCERCLKQLEKKQIKTEHNARLKQAFLKVIIKLHINSDINYVLISVFCNLFKNKIIEDKSESEALWSTLSFI